MMTLCIGCVKDFLNLATRGENGHFSREKSRTSSWVGLMNIIIVGTFKGVPARKQQTAKMAEGPDPGKTSRKSELVSALSVMYNKMSRNTFTFLSTVYTTRCCLLISSTVAATPTLKELSNALDSIVNWYSLGVKLGLKEYELSTIEQNYHGDSERCKLEMLSGWLRTAKLPTWKAVADALQLMKEQAVASKIRAKYCSSSTDSADIAGKRMC